MFCRHVFGNISGGFCGISRFFGNFAEFRGSTWILQVRDRTKYQKPWWADGFHSSSVIWIPQRNFTCPSGKLITEFTSLIAKSTSPGLSDTTFFIRCTQDVLLAHQAILHNFLGEGTGDKAQRTSAREAMTRATLKWSRRGGCDDFIKLAFPHAIEDRVLGTNKFWVFNLQGLYRSWKTWKVMEFKNFIFRAWKVVEFNCRSLKVMENQSFV